MQLFTFCRIFCQLASCQRGKFCLEYTLLCQSTVSKMNARVRMQNLCLSRGKGDFLCCGCGQASCAQCVHNCLVGGNNGWMQVCGMLERTGGGRTTQSNSNIECVVLAVVIVFLFLIIAISCNLTY